MAEQVVDRIVGKYGPKGTTLNVKLFGHEGCKCVNQGLEMWLKHSPTNPVSCADEDNLTINLIQKYGMSDEVAEHLVRTYGGQAWDVCELSQPTQGKWPRFGVPIVTDYPYIEAEVTYACREYACTVEDILSRRTRLAFLNKGAALEAVPKVAKIMAKELGWTEEVMAKQVAAATQYIESYSGSLDNKAAMMREASYTDLQDVFRALDLDGNGFLDVQDVSEIAAILGMKMTDKEIRAAFEQMDKNNTGRVTAEAFEGWWNASQNSPFHKKLTKELGVLVSKKGDLKKLGMFG